jgi:hypothetical protein
MWTWRMNDPAAGPRPVGRGLAAWRRAGGRTKLLAAAVPIIVGLLVGSCAIWLAAAALALDSPGGVAGASGPVVNESISLFPPGGRYTVISDGEELSVLQPWHDAPLGTVVVGLGAGLVAAGLVALPVLIVFGAVARSSSPASEREGPRARSAPTNDMVDPGTADPIPAAVTPPERWL